MKRTPVVLIHGAWFHRSCWEGWAERFAAHGYAVSVPARPGPVAHYERIVRAFDTPPVLVGHSAGGLIVQRLLGAGLGRAAVALAPLPVGGVPPVAADALPGPLPRSRFRQLVANAVGEREAEELFERYAVPARLPLLTDLGPDPDAAHADSAVDTANAMRGPLLLVSGQEDRLVPDAVTRAVYKLYGDSPAVTDLKQFADRGHSLVFDSGWRAVADHVLGWLAANGAGPVADHGRASGF